MKPSERLEKITQIKAQAESEAGQRLAQARAEHEQKTGQLEQLKAYRQEYSGRFIASGQKGMQPEQLQDFHLFLARIDAAIAQQTRLVERSTSQVERCRQDWLDEHTKTKSLSMATDGLRQKEAEEAQRRERKQLEDLTQQRYLREQNGPG